ncbi:hypothetical protein FHR81_005381 [Actinoalloteichus hoggarensis]|uniref:Uncharacterized protein n=1 Tax=Actinoalloteichus hoggarensis TaxID=1470176 RepID=A0A221VWH6_9PSEU|nr:hypothetical protein [Actinoalloteichus hoggarensis]ASO17892.1 hypothetical protein AHOG_01125 [Actinoalloteichus hoggarensis]MBB5924304.1 hypothetical protein [Actinoalloteichus hoggarensis]
MISRHTVQSAATQAADVGRTRTRSSGRPASVRAAFSLWLLALTTGVLETMLGITGELIGPEGAMTVGAILAAAGLRVVVTVVFVALALLMRDAWNWARVCLAVLLGGVGLLTMVADPIGDLASGASVAAAFGTAGPLGGLFAVVRLVHLLAVPAAVIAMFLPSANAYFRRG